MDLDGFSFKNGSVQMEKTKIINEDEVLDCFETIGFSVRSPLVLQKAMDFGFGPQWATSLLG